MESIPNTAAALGLRHVIEDGVAALEGRLNDDARQHFVMGDLAKLLQKAMRGVQITEGGHLFVQEGDVSAFEAYSLIFRYLSETYQNALKSNIDSTSSTLSKLTKHEIVPDVDRKAASDFFARLLGQLHRDEAYCQQREPEIIGARQL